MTWNPEPQIAAARDFARQFKADRVMIVYTTRAGQLHAATYGETKALCRDAKSLGDLAFDAVLNDFEHRADYLASSKGAGGR